MREKKKQKIEIAPLLMMLLVSVGGYIGYMEISQKSFALPLIGEVGILLLLAIGAIGLLFFSMTLVNNKELNLNSR